MRHLIAVAIVLGGILLGSGCGREPQTAPALPERSVEVAQVTVVAVPERLDAAGAVVRLTLDTHTTPLDMELPAAARLSVGGRDWPAQTWNGEGPGGHHRTGVLRFRAGGPVTGPVQLVFDGFGAAATLTWPTAPR